MFLELSGADSIQAAKAAPAESLRKANYEIVLNAQYGHFGFGMYAQSFFLGGSCSTVLEVWLLSAIKVMVSKSTR